MEAILINTERISDADEAWRDGYIQAIKDFGIWKDGVQRIGCLETPIKEIIARLDSAQVSGK